MADRLHTLRARARAARAQSHATARQAEATWEQIQTQWQLVQMGWQRAERLGQLWLTPPGSAERLRHSAFARLQARLASMPVIEQAKGILMAQCGWTAEQAFGALRRASQRHNVKVRDLAVDIVARTGAAAPTQLQWHDMLTRPAKATRSHVA